MIRILSRVLSIDDAPTSMVRACICTLSDVQMISTTPKHTVSAFCCLREDPDMPKSTSSPLKNRLASVSYMGATAYSAARNPFGKAMPTETTISATEPVSWKCIRFTDAISVLRHFNALAWLQVTKLAEDTCLAGRIAFMISIQMPHCEGTNIMFKDTIATE